MVIANFVRKHLKIEKPLHCTYEWIYNSRLSSRQALKDNRLSYNRCHPTKASSIRQQQCCDSKSVQITVKQARGKKLTGSLLLLFTSSLLLNIDVAYRSPWNVAPSIFLAGRRHMTDISGDQPYII